MRKISILFLFIFFSAFSLNPPTDIIKIMNSGDGKSIKTAYVVNSVEEEYDLLTHLKLKSIMQKLIIKDGYFYDAITTNSKVIFFKLKTKKLPN